MSIIGAKNLKLNEVGERPQENSMAAVLEVLTITVLIDGRIHPVEPQEFSEQIKNLRIFTDDYLSYGNGLNIQKWCITNWGAIQERLSNSHRTEYVKEALSVITDESLQLMIYTSMNQICRCDNEMHQREAELLKLAAKAWELS